MPTRESRARLPQRLRREDAIFNVGRAALLVAALEQGMWEMLDAATQDRLHQSARAESFPALYDIIDAAKEAGAHGAYLSGGGLRDSSVHDRGRGTRGSPDAAGRRRSRVQRPLPDYGAERGGHGAAGQLAKVTL